MTKERELLRRAVEALKYWMDETSHSVDWELLEDIEAHLAAEEGKQERPVGFYVEPLRADQEDWFHPYFVANRGFKVEAKIHSRVSPVYLHPSCPQNKETATRSEDVVTEATDQKSLNWTAENERAYVECEKLDAIFPSPQVEQRKPLSNHEVFEAFWKYPDRVVDDVYSFSAGVSFAEKHHGISE